MVFLFPPGGWWCVEASPGACWVFLSFGSTCLYAFSFFGWRVVSWLECLLVLDVDCCLGLGFGFLQKFLVISARALLLEGLPAERG